MMRTTVGLRIILLWRPDPFQSMAPSISDRHCVRCMGGLPMTVGGWRGEPPDGPGTLRITRTREELVGDGWGDGATWFLQRLPAIGGLEDDPSRFQPDDGIVAELHRQNPGRRFGRTDLVFDSIVVAICGQKVTGKEAANAVRGLYQRFADPAPGPNPGLRLPPDPEKMAAAPYYEYHSLHLEKRRAEVLRSVARDADRIEGLALADPKAAASVLESYHGISRWTSASTLSVSHGDPDQVAVGDFHIKNTVVHHLTGRDRGTDEEMLELLEPFRPHRGRVVRLLHLQGHAPKFGPRSKPRDITKM